MNIAVVGAGNMGTGLGKIWARKGHNITFSFTRSPEKLSSLVSEIPGSRTASAAEAAAAAEVVLLSVPWNAVPDALEAAGLLDGKTIIDCTNPLSPDLGSLQIGHSTSAAEEIAKLRPGARVVKAFNTVFASIYHSESRLFGSRRPTMFFCGDDNDAKHAVSRLINEVGFSPLDAGPLVCARYLEPMAMLMIQMAYKQGMGTEIALSLINR